MEELDFEIRNPKPARIISYVFFALSLIACIVFAVLASLEVLPPATGWRLFGAMAACLCIFAVCVYVCIREKFTLRDGMLCYIKPFRKLQSVAIADVSRMELRHEGRFCKVVLFDKFEQVAMFFLDDGTAFANGKFVSALEAYHIQIKA